MRAPLDKAGGSALAVPTDVSDPLAVQDAVDVAVAHFGALHLAVNNAGIASESVDIQPGVIATPMLGPDSGPIAAQVPARRIGEPSEIATAVAFLLSGDASYVTGAHLAVDGGFLG
ncbi:MAG TPA: SDR family oxidoreductase [Streptosporangiaceae bacterium]|nr:SDR family oxidoreductase [Streptosporangiaceae bacterium]